MSYRVGTHAEGEKEHIDFIDDVSIHSLKVTVKQDDRILKKNPGSMKKWDIKHKINT